MSRLCDRCGRPAIYLDRRSGTALCREHFVEMLEEKVRRQVRSELRSTGGIGKKLRIALGISGGKDSLVMMDLLWRVEREYDVELVAVTVDEGIEGGAYRGRRIPIARKMAEERDIAYEVKTFKEVYGFTLDEAVEALKGEEDPCSICGVLRRRALNDAAKALGADYLAIAHNLDDEAETVLMNVIRGDADAIRRSEVYAADLARFYVPRIKPLRRLTERETAFYAYLLGIPPEEDECPYAGASLRDEVRDILESLESKRPGTSDALVRVGEELKEGNAQTKRSFCSICGYPTGNGRTTCRVCEIKASVSLRAETKGKELRAVREEDS